MGCARPMFIYPWLPNFTSPPQNQTVSVNQLHTECRRPARVNQVLTLSDPLITERGKVTHFKSNFQENLRVIDKQNCSFKEFSRLKKRRSQGFTLKWVQSLQYIYTRRVSEVMYPYSRSAQRQLARFNPSSEMKPEAKAPSPFSSVRLPFTSVIALPTYRLCWTYKCGDGCGLVAPLSAASDLSSLGGFSLTAWYYRPCSSHAFRHPDCLYHFGASPQWWADGSS